MKNKTKKLSVETLIEHPKTKLFALRSSIKEDLDALTKNTDVIEEKKNSTYLKTSGSPCNF